MPSDLRIQQALDALAEPIKTFRSTLANTSEQIRLLISTRVEHTGATEKVARAELGEFAAGRIDAERMAKLFSGVEPPTIGHSEAVARALDVCNELLARRENLFRIEVAEGDDLRTAVGRALADIGRAFAATRIVELIAQLDISQVLIGRVPLAPIVFYYCAIVFTAYVYFRRPLTKKLICTAMFLSMTVYLGVLKWQRTYRDELVMTCLDVGHGQAVLLGVVQELGHGQPPQEAATPRGGGLQRRGELRRALDQLLLLHQARCLFEERVEFLVRLVAGRRGGHRGRSAAGIVTAGKHLVPEPRPRLVVGEGCVVAEGQVEQAREAACE